MKEQRFATLFGTPGTVRGLNIPGLKVVVIFNGAETIHEYQLYIGHLGRLGHGETSNLLLTEQSPPTGDWKEFLDPFGIDLP